MKHNIWAGGVLFLLSVVPTVTVQACTLEPLTAEQEKISKVEGERALIRMARAADAIVEVKVTRSSGVNMSHGTVKVLNILRGKAKQGQRLTLSTMSGNLCGAGTIKKGQRGIILLDAKRLHFDGFLWPEQIAILEAEGIIAPTNAVTPQR